MSDDLRKHSFRLWRKMFRALRIGRFPNLAARISELPADIGNITELRILTDPIGSEKLKASLALGQIRRMVPVRLDDTIEKAGYDTGLAGMGRLVRPRLVYQASLEQAAIIFCPPDLV